MIDAHPDPLAHFAAWFRDAEAAGVADREVVALATATAGGHPAVRQVLCRGIGGGGLRFFTNLDSRKGAHLAINPHAAMAFHWGAQRRQVRFEGAVVRLSAHEDDEQFAARPRSHQLAAWASDQSRPLASYDQLLSRYGELERRHEGAPIPRPPTWGGFRLTPTRAEFRQGQPNRLHERLEYVREGEGWVTRLLAP